MIGVLNKRGGDKDKTHREERPHENIVTGWLSTK
jgi:hypothetical protein